MRAESRGPGTDGKRAATMTRETVSPPTQRKSDLACYALAALAGLGTGWADVIVNDLLFTALLVLTACMLLGLLRPRWPWRWVVAVVVFNPGGEADAGTGLWIVSDRASGNGGGVRRRRDAPGD
jgi:hypothetical protein